MPINVACQCGKSFAAPDNLAGKIVKCPSCSQPLQIPAMQAAPTDGLSDLMAEAGLGASATGHSCPECQKDLPAEAVLCVACGYNLQTGQKLQTMTAAGVRVGASETEKMLAKAAKEIEETPAKHDEGYGTTGGAWLMFGGMAVVASISVISVYVAFKWIDEKPGERSSVVMNGLGIAFLCIGIVWTIVLGFKDSPLQGFLCLVPGYQILYIIFHFGACMFPGILIAVGSLMMVIAPLLQMDVGPSAQ